jgi:EAL domain-containing protein (putative c-di-GMP-specific phosphodiesterase class I)
MLASWGCDEGQGFYMSPPLDAARFAAQMLAPMASVPEEVAVTHEAS